MISSSPQFARKIVRHVPSVHDPHKEEGPQKENAIDKLRGAAGHIKLVQEATSS